MEEVSAVKGKDDIYMVGRLLAKHGSIDYQDIWELGINTALRISDLLGLSHKDVDNVDVLTLKEQKTGKIRQITLNSKAKGIIARRAAENPTDRWLFQSKGNRAASMEKAIDRSTVARKFKEIGEIIGISLGTHSMRKTRGYAMWSDGVPIEVICKVLNHSSPAVTMRYIGIEREDVQKTYDDYIL